MRYLEAACLVVITAAFVLLLLTCRTFVAHRDTEAVQLAGEASAVLSQASAVLSRADAGVAQLNLATAAQMGTLDRTDREVLKASADLHDLLAHTDISLNGTVEHPGALPALTTAVQSVTSLSGRGISFVNDLEAQEGPILSDFRTASDAFALQSPVILKNTASTASYVADTSNSADMSMHDIQGFIHRETAPITGTWNIIKAFLREFAGPAAEIATAAK